MLKKMWCGIACDDVETRNERSVEWGSGGDVKTNTRKINVSCGILHSADNYYWNVCAGGGADKGMLYFHSISPL